MRIFVSYNNRDRDIAARLREAVLRQRPELDLYFAPIRNTAGAYWITRLGEELAAADAVLLLVGERIGAWQQLEYFEALMRSRQTKRPLILPVVLTETMPGLPFLDHFHRLILERQPLEELVGQLLTALDGVEQEDSEPLWRRVNPYRGLAAMDTAHAAYFFGREALTAAILETLRLRTDRVLTLVGNSGVGKSSVAQAGVLAALRSRLWPGDWDLEWPADLHDSPSWLTVKIVLGEHPLKALAQGFVRTWLDSPADIEREALKWVALFEQGADLGALVEAARTKLSEATAAELPAKALLYVDQGEELYTRAEASEAERFSALIAAAVPRPDLVVMTSLRADYYGHLQNDKPLFEVSERLDVPPLGEAQLEQMIREPAARLGVRFDNPDMVPVIAQAAGREPGTLPMLSYLMADAWEAMRRDEANAGVLRFPFQVVDISRPLAERAERFLELHPDSEVQLRRLFTLKLAHVPAEGEPVRRRTMHSECSVAQWNLAQELAERDWRLLATSEVNNEPAVEVAHEALLHSWPRLERWLDEERAFLVWKGQLEARRREYQAAPDEWKPDALLRGLPLDTARHWYTTRGDDLAPTDQAFIALSIEGDKDKARRKARNRVRLTGLSIAAVVVLAMTAIVAVWQWQLAEVAANKAEVAAENARVARQLAEERRHVAEGRLQHAQIEQARFRANKALELVNSGDVTAGIAVALSAMPQAHPDGWPTLSRIPEVSIALTTAMRHRRELAVFRGHEDSVRSAAFSPDGARVVTASEDFTARIWDADSGDELAMLRGHEYEVYAAAFSPDGARVVTASGDDTARVWDANSGNEIAVLRGHEESVYSAAFSPDGVHVVTASNDDTARLWDADSGDEIHVLRGHEYWVQAAEFSPDGTHVITASWDGTARLWDADSGDEIAVLRGHEGSVYSAAFSPDGGRVVTSSLDGTARLWDADSADATHVLHGHESGVNAAAFSSDGTRVITASNDGTARLWDADSGDAITVLRGHEDVVWSAALSPDSARVITFSPAGTARLWDAETGDELAVLRDHDTMVLSATFSPDGARVVTASDDGTAHLWDAGSGLAVLRGHKAQVFSVAFSPDGARVISASSDGTARLWDVNSGNEIAILRGHETVVHSAAFSPDGARAATASWDGTARLWDANRGKEIAVLRGHENWVYSVAFSSDGTRLVTASYDGTARLWDADSGDATHVLHVGVLGVNAAAFTSDGTRVVTASKGRTARLWSADDGAPITLLHGHQDEVNAAEFSPDGARVVTASKDGTARLWDADSGDTIAVLRSHKGWVLSAAFSPDGAHVVTASNDGTARLWEADSGNEVAVLRGHEGSVNSAAFSPDGTHVGTSSDDGTVRLWRHYPSALALFEQAEEIVDRLRPLSDQEKCDYYLKTSDC